jgi:DNA-binding NtrC family response regulator
MVHKFDESAAVFNVPERISPPPQAGPDCQPDRAAVTGCLGNALWHSVGAGSESDVGPELWIVPSAAPELRTMIDRVAPTDATVMIVGESGTGKEVTARFIHHVSRRRGSFVPVNMAAIPRELAESQLFGHERGAFTGASVARCGYCEAAHGGTLFLDEVTEMELGLQAKLLRFLEDQTVQRVGSTVSLRVDVRVIAATNRDPEQAVRDLRLREDVFYRLNVISIRLPALREHPVDICPLANVFLTEANGRYRRNVQAFTPAAMKLLEAYHWPGNIRELKNCVERMVILTGDPQISLADLPDVILRNATGRSDAADASGGAPRQPPDRTLVHIEHQVILDELLKWKGNVQQTARSLGIARSTLYRKLKQIHHSAPDR